MTNTNSLFTYLVRQADNQLIIGHRISEWCGKGPVLEEDIALINTALDFLGQSRSLYQEAVKIEGKGRTEDDLPYLRREREFMNCLMCEQPNGNYADTIARQFLFDAFYYFYYQKLENSSNEFLSAFATKSLKEVTYHLRFSTGWLCRLGDGTEESHEKMQKALNNMWIFAGELFETDSVEEELQKEGIVPDMNPIKEEWLAFVTENIKKATLEIPKESFETLFGGRKGIHTEYLGHILSELQYMQRALPNCEW